MKENYIFLMKKEEVFFDEINDRYEKNIMINDKNYRIMPTSIAIKADNNTEYSFY